LADEAASLSFLFSFFLFFPSFILPFPFSLSSLSPSYASPYPLHRTHAVVSISHSQPAARSHQDFLHRWPTELRRLLPPPQPHQTASPAGPAPQLMPTAGEPRACQRRGAVGYRASGTPASGGEYIGHRDAALGGERIGHGERPGASMLRVKNTARFTAVNRGYRPNRVGPVPVLLGIPQIQI
jgi:hypothetical protein